MPSPTRLTMPKMIPIFVLVLLYTLGHAKEIDSKTDLQQEESMAHDHRTYLPAPSGHHQSGGPIVGASSETQPEVWPSTGRADLPQIKALNVKCEKNHMKINVEFDRPFYGMIFSKGHYSDNKCIHQAPGSGHLSTNFDIYMGSCGMSSSSTAVAAQGQSPSGLYIENTIVIQYDPQVQEIWDQARRLRCTWYDYYEKAVTFRPFPVDMLDVVRADFAGDNVGCWIQIQQGKGPWASEVSGIVKIGQTMTLVLAIKDDDNKFDMHVRNCIAHDGKRAPIELVDGNGCIVRPKLMSKFTKIKNFGSSASVLSYAHFQAFKFPDSIEVMFQCTIQICRHQCPEQCSGQPAVDGDQFVQATKLYHSVVKPRSERMRRDASLNETSYEVNDISLNRVLQVISPGDVAFALSERQQSPEGNQEELSTDQGRSELICMSTLSFTGASILLIVLLIVSCMVAVFAWSGLSNRCAHREAMDKSMAALGYDGLLKSPVPTEANWKGLFLPQFT